MHRYKLVLGHLKRVEEGGIAEEYTVPNCAMARVFGLPLGKAISSFRARQGHVFLSPRVSTLEIHSAMLSLANSDTGSF